MGSAGAGKSKRMPREVREREMLDAAVVTFGQRGYRSASMDEIAELAGVSKPLVYLYLNSKEELFTACIRREADALLTAVRAGVVEPGSRPTSNCGRGSPRSSRTPRRTRTPGRCCTGRPVRTGSPSPPK